MGAPVMEGSEFSLRHTRRGRRRTYQPTTATTMSKDSKTTLRGRDAGTGEFTTVEEAREKPNTHVVERVPKPGYGDTGKGK